MGGGGGSSDIQMRNFGQEIPRIRRGYNFQTGQLNQFGENQPLLREAQTGATGFWNQLPSLLGQITGYQSALGGDQATLARYRAQVDPTIASGGALTGEGLRTAQQQARAAASAGGTVHDTSAVAGEVLNAEAAREARFNTALAQGQGIVGQQAGLTGQQAGLTGQTQSMQTNALNQLIGVEGARTTNFGNVTNPILQYLGSLFGGNQQASIAQAQIGAAQQAQSKSGTSGAIGGAISGIASIAAAY